jgi:hypothetical protein
MNTEKKIEVIKKRRGRKEEKKARKSILVETNFQVFLPLRNRLYTVYFSFAIVLFFPLHFAL